LVPPKETLGQAINQNLDLVHLCIDIETFVLVAAKMKE
jgi:hypothetical protein